MPVTAFIATKGWSQDDEGVCKQNVDLDADVLNRTIRWFTPTNEVLLPTLK